MNPNQMNQLIKMLGMINNPETYVQQLMKSNPNMMAMVNQIQQGGMGMTEYLKDYAQKNNIDLGPITDMLNKKGIKF